MSSSSSSPIFDCPSKVINPSPENESVVSLDVILSWDKISDVRYDLYFGTTSILDFGEYLGGLYEDNNMYDLGTLSPGIYYWRVDTKNQYCITKGDVWQFMVQEPSSSSSSSGYVFETSYLLDTMKEIVIHNMSVAQAGGIDKKEEIIDTLTHELMMETLPNYLEMEELVAAGGRGDMLVDFFLGYSDPQKEITELALPVVDAGISQDIIYPATAIMQGTVGGPTPIEELIIEWSKDGGDGDVYFDDSSSLNAVVSFSEPGFYLLRLTASNDDVSAYGVVSIAVRTP